MLNFKKDTCLKIIFFISLISLFSALFIEYALGHQPCSLCLIQRIPYALSIILIIFDYLLKKNGQFIILLLLIIFSFSLIISFYHFGIEQGFFEESLVCKLGTSNDSLSKDQLLKQLEGANISCKEVTFRLLGLSLATINTIISVIISCIMLKVIKNYGQNK